MDYRDIEVPFHDYLGFRLEVDGSPSRVVMDLGEHVRGSVAPLHGGVLCSLLDIACGAAAGGNDDYDSTTTIPVSTRLDVQFLGQPRSGPLLATAQVVGREGGSISVQGEVADGGGYVIGRATGTYRLVTGFVGHGRS